MKALPFIISIPHGGTDIPEELRTRTSLTREDILEDGDAFTQDIFDLGSNCPVVKMKYGRAFLDLNREPGTVPPNHPDGIIKEKTCYLKQVYHPGKNPDPQLIETLVNRYYNPYYEKINEIVHSGDVVFGFDCHSMAVVAPPISSDAGTRRPMINLGNSDGRSCDTQTVHMLAEWFRDHYDLSEGDVTINNPFKGGRITRIFGKNPIPWVQVEISRTLYLREPWFDPETWQIEQKRLEYLRNQFLTILYRFADQY